jgi:hypothetical protein
MPLKPDQDPWGCLILHPLKRSQLPHLVLQVVRPQVVHLAEVLRVARLRVLVFPVAVPQVVQLRVVALQAADLPVVQLRVVALRVAYPVQVDPQVVWLLVLNLPVTRLLREDLKVELQAIFLLALRVVHPVQVDPQVVRLTLRPQAEVKAHFNLKCLRKWNAFVLS